MAPVLTTAFAAWRPTSSNATAGVIVRGMAAGTKAPSTTAIGVTAGAAPAWTGTPLTSTGTIWTRRMRSRPRKMNDALCWYTQGVIRIPAPSALAWPRLRGAVLVDRGAVLAEAGVLRLARGLSRLALTRLTRGVLRLTAPRLTRGVSRLALVRGRVSVRVWVRVRVCVRLGFGFG